MTPRQLAVATADKWASLDVRLDGKCVLALPDCAGPIVCGHLFPRTAFSTRWDERNLYCLCAYHNGRMEDDPKIQKALEDYARTLWADSQIEELHRLYESAYPVKLWEIREHVLIWRGKYRKHLQWRAGNMVIGFRLPTGRGA